jgi:Uma2 family endonuclease
MNLLRAIEVVWTSGGISKLSVYARLGVPEVWMWMKGKLQVYALSGTRYSPIAMSGTRPTGPRQ